MLDALAHTPPTRAAMAAAVESLKQALARPYPPKNGGWPGITPKEEEA